MNIVTEVPPKGFLRRYAGIENRVEDPSPTGGVTVW
jgi:hypothetical protein